MVKSGCLIAIFLMAVARCGATEESTSHDGEHHQSGYVEPEIDPADREHWSFLPVQPPAVDPAAGHPIDVLIDRRLQEHDLRRSEPADRLTLLRRTCLDLIGLPPTVKQIEQFRSGQLQLPQLIDELLQSERYGERWAQHWLDLARFAETDGFEHDKIRPDAWRYRDWVIDAINRDLPFDDFIRLQIAGDQIHPDDPQAKIATMFCLSGPDMPDINLLEERRHNVLNELTSTLGEVVLGLQIGCAQCHDHKYDPISQADFYRLRAIFEPAVSLQKNKSLTSLSSDRSNDRSAWLMLRGDFRRKGPQVAPNVPRVLQTKTGDASNLQSTSGDARTAFANWLVSEDNPLTARVFVNRIWQQHFGRGLVDTPADFGLVGSVPDDPELLDYLADWFVRNGWSCKKLHRLILSSETWQQFSLLAVDADESDRLSWQSAMKLDPDLRLLSRFPRRRLDAEVIRDCMLAAAGLLNTKMNGPGVRPPLPPELKQTLLKNQWPVTEEKTEHDRRSIYLFARRNLRFPILETFDRPSANSSCAQRRTSTTAPQALYLLNSEFSWRVVRSMGDRISAESKDQQQQIEVAWLRVLNRPPTAQELAGAAEFLAQHRMDGASDADCLAHLALTLFNTNEFLFVD